MRNFTSLSMEEIDTAFMYALKGSMATGAGVDGRVWQAMVQTVLFGALFTLLTHSSPNTTIFAATFTVVLACFGFLVL